MYLKLIINDFHETFLGIEIVTDYCHHTQIPLLSRFFKKINKDQAKKKTPKQNNKKICLCIYSPCQGKRFLVFIFHNSWEEQRYSKFCSRTVIVPFSFIQTFDVI